MGIERLSCADLQNEERERERESERERERKFSWCRL